MVIWRKWTNRGDISLLTSTPNQNSPTLRWRYDMLKIIYKVIILLHPCWSSYYYLNISFYSIILLEKLFNIFSLINTIISPLYF